MVEGGEPLGSSDVSIVGVAMPEREATARGVVKTVVGGDDVEIRLGEPLLPL